MVPRLVVAAALAAAGCSEIRAAARARDPGAPGPGERTVAAKGLGLAPGASLAMERGIEIALEHNPEVARARSRVLAAEARLAAARAGLLPEASASASARRDWTGGNTVAGTRETETRSAGGTLSLLLFDWGRTRADVRRAAEERLAAGLELRDRENAVVLAVRQAFLGVLKQEELLRVSEETVRQFERRRDQVKGFVEVGSRTRYDLTKAEVDLGNAGLARSRARSGLASQRALLWSALGLVEDPGARLLKPAADEADAPAFDRLAEEARGRHPLLASLARREEAALAGVDASVAALLPSLSLDAQVRAEKRLDVVSWSASVAGVAQWILYRGGAQRAAVRAALADLGDARASRAQAEQQVVREIRQALAAFEDARDRLRIARMTARQAGENLTLVEGRFAVGRASSVEMTDAQAGLSNARGEAVQAEFDLHAARAALDRAGGGPR